MVANVENIIRIRRKELGLSQEELAKKCGVKLKGESKDWVGELTKDESGYVISVRLGSQEVLRFEVSGEQPQAVHMLPGYTHSITNLSQTEPLVTLMWANELFDPQRPDTFYEAVEP